MLFPVEGGKCGAVVGGYLPVPRRPGEMAHVGVVDPDSTQGVRAKQQN